MVQVVDGWILGHATAADENAVDWAAPGAGILYDPRLEVGRG
jgi:hypothetical protein